MTDLGNVIAHALGEVAGADEYSRLCLMGGRGTHEVPQLVHPNSISPALGLHINGVQAKPVFIDHANYAKPTRPPVHPIPRLGLSKLLGNLLGGWSGSRPI